jgi:hypothetical protein
MRKAFALLAFSKLNFIMSLGHPDGRSAGHFAIEWTSVIAFEKHQFAASRLCYGDFYKRFRYLSARLAGMVVA